MTNAISRTLGEFDAPLTKIGFLTFMEINRLETEGLTGDGKLTHPLIIISGILKLYGAKIVHIHSGYSKSF